MIYDKRPLTIPWYMDLILMFVMVKYNHDHESGVTICYKQLFGKTYVLSEITADEDPA